MSKNRFNILVRPQSLLRTIYENLKRIMTLRQSGPKQEQEICISNPYFDPVTMRDIQERNVLMALENQRINLIQNRIEAARQSKNL